MRPASARRLPFWQLNSKLFQCMAEKTHVYVEQSVEGQLKKMKKLLALQKSFESKAEEAMSRSANSNSELPRGRSNAASNLLSKTNYIFPNASNSIARSGIHHNAEHTLLMQSSGANSIQPQLTSAISVPL